MDNVFAWRSHNPVMPSTSEAIAASQAWRAIHGEAAGTSKIILECGAVAGIGSDKGRATIADGFVELHGLIWSVLTGV